MGDTTAKYHLPYPFSTDPPNGSSQIRALAEQTEAVFAGQFVERAANGAIVITTGGIARPIPFASWTVNITATFNNSALYVATVTMPSGRFTVAPIVMATTSWHFYNASVSLVTASAVTFEVGHINSTPQNATLSVYGHATQMTPTSAQGRLAGPQATAITVRATCHTAGCDNAEVTLTVQTVEGAAVLCGVCGQPIVDLA